MLILVLILGVIGAFLIKQVQAPGESLYQKHLLGLAGGTVMAVIISLIDYHFIARFYIVLYAINLVLLILVKTMGATYNHAQRWLDFGLISFQPSELSKIILIIFLDIFMICTAIK
jgi:rod shape determining protein RodA